MKKSITLTKLLGAALALVTLTTAFTSCGGDKKAKTELRLMKKEKSLNLQ